ncbi:MULTISPECIES: hypothetical protein [Sorangium]|nr:MULTISPECIES: hypothetical protein [Sorangium]
MNPALRGVAEHMKNLGLGALTHALRLSLYSTPENPSWGDLSVLHAAHAAEILIKSRLAAEHPLLIFTQIPKSTQTAGALLDFEDLFERGQTLDFQDLPERLWAATGIRLSRVDVFVKFGKLRNAIQHFAPPTVNPSARTLEFVFHVLDPFIFETWGLYAIDFNEEFGDHYEHIFDSLVRNNIRPLISPDAARAWSSLDYKPGKDAPAGYANWFKSSMKAALEIKTKNHGS